MKRTVFEASSSAIVAFVVLVAFLQVDLAAKDSAPELTAKKQAESSGIATGKQSFFVEGYVDGYVRNLVSKEKRPVYVPHAGDDGEAWLAGFTQGIKDSDDRGGSRPAMCRIESGTVLWRTSPP